MFLGRILGTYPLLKFRPGVLVYSIACLPDEGHITGPRCSFAIVDKDRVCSGHLDVYQVVEIDEQKLNPWVMAELGVDSKPTHRTPAPEKCNKLT